MRQMFLAARAAFFVLLLPGTVAGSVPFLDPPGREPSPHSCTFHLLRGSQWPCRRRCGGPSQVRLGLLRHWQRAHSRPVDPPRHLVVCGLYRYTRNPMLQNGVLTLLLGEAWFFGCTSLHHVHGVGPRRLPPFRHPLRGAHPHGTVQRVLSGISAFSAALGLHDPSLPGRDREHRLTCRCSGPCHACFSALRAGKRATAAERRSLSPR